MNRKTVGFAIALLWYSIMIAGVFCFVGYKVAYNRMEISKSTLDTQTFYATISDIRNNIFTVTGMEVNDINFRGEFRFSVAEGTKITWCYTDISVDDLDVGDNIAITFTGGILETDPGQIQQVEVIQLLGDGNTEEENDKQYDSQADLIYNNGLPYGQPMNFDTGGLPDAYIDVIQEYCRTGMFPDGQDGGDIPGKISYAVYDVDGDSKDELILKNQDTITAGMTERVYAYEGGVFREEFSGFPALTYYDNGLIQAEWSHNQGKAGDRLWPYTLYKYQPDDDSYIMLEAVDAWDKELADFTSDWGAFPDDIDTDGDGYIYFLLPSDWEGQYSRADIVDDSDYENWRNDYLGGAETLEIPYRELEVETVFPDAAG